MRDFGLVLRVKGSSFRFGVSGLWACKAWVGEPYSESE